MTTRPTTSTSAAGIRCDCGSTQFRVLRTTASAGCLIRRRVCSLCGKRITTAERQIGTANATGSGLLAISIGQIEESLKLIRDLASSNSTDPQN